MQALALWGLGAIMQSQPSPELHHAAAQLHAAGAGGKHSVLGERGPATLPRHRCLRRGGLTSGEQPGADRAAARRRTAVSAAAPVRPAAAGPTAPAPPAAAAPHTLAAEAPASGPTHSHPLMCSALGAAQCDNNAASCGVGSAMAAAAPARPTCSNTLSPPQKPVAPSGVAPRVLAVPGHAQSQALPGSAGLLLRRPQRCHWRRLDSEYSTKTHFFCTGLTPALEGQAAVGCKVILSM